MSDDLGGSAPEYRVAAGLSRAADLTLGAVAALVLFAMMAVTAVDVVGRYFFNAPLQGGYEFTQLLMLALVFAALPSVTRRSEHVSVGLFDNAFRGPLLLARDAIVALIVAAVAGYLAWRLYILGNRFSGFGDVTATVQIPLAPFAYGGAIAMVLTAVASLLILADGFAPPRRAEGER